RRRRRRRGGRGRRHEGEAEGQLPSDEEAAEEAELAPAEARVPVEADRTEEPPSGEEAASPRGRRRRRRGGRGPVVESVETEEPAIEVDSSPMVERPTDEEPPIAETQPAEEAKPK